MKWDRITKRARDHAHLLRKALAAALELHVAGTWSQVETEEAGLRDYRRVFGHSITPRTFRTIFNRTLERAGESRDFTALELYLPNVVTKAKPSASFERAAATLPVLSAAVLGIADPLAPGPAELQLVWVSACEEWKRLNEAGILSHKAQKIVISALAASGLELAESDRALRVAFVRKRELWIKEGYSAAALRDRRLESSGNFKPLPITEVDEKFLKGRAVQTTVTKAWRDALKEGSISSAAIATYIANPASKSYVPQRVRDLVAPDVARMKNIHLGPHQADLKGAYISRDWAGVMPGDWYSGDDTTAPIYYWEEDDQGKPRWLRGQTLLMNDCGTNRILAFALHPERSYTAKVIRGLIMRTHDSYGLPRNGFYFEHGIWQSAKLLHGSADEVPSEETELGLREWVDFKHALPGNARAKTVERIIGLFQSLIQDQPGYCGRNEQIEKHERLQRQLLDATSGKLHPKEFLLHKEEWTARLASVCDEYNRDRQDGDILRGLSPNEAWDARFNFSNPLLRLTDDVRYLLANHRRPLKITRNGICIQIGKERFWFHNEITGRFEGEIVQVYFNPEDLSSVFLMRSLGDKTAYVVPLSPKIPAMSATREQMAAARSLVVAHNRPSRTMYQEVKTHFKDNGPSHFRRVVADADAVELGQDIAADQAAIAKENSTEIQTRRKLAKYERKLGRPATNDAVSDARKLAGYQLLQEANSNAD